MADLGDKLGLFYLALANGTFLYIITSLRHPLLTTITTSQSSVNFTANQEYSPEEREKIDECYSDVIVCTQDVERYPCNNEPLEVLVEIVRDCHRKSAPKIRAPLAEALRGMIQ
jgi:hypothetical protein